MNVIEELTTAAPMQRPQILQGLYEKNLSYFEKKHPQIHAGLMNGASPYEINITDDFLDIISTETGQSCFMGAGAVETAEYLGGWAHQAWTDLIDLKLRTHPEQYEHSQIVRRFSQGLLDAFPQFGDRFKGLQVGLPDLDEGKKFSNPVVFIGLFHGLHIAHYLEHTEVRTAAFIEPDPERFEVSCYFLDYESLDRQFDGLLIHVGGELDNAFFRVFLTRAYVSGKVWVRTLFGYASDANGYYLQKLNSQWQALLDDWLPADQHLAAMSWCMENLRSQRNCLLAAPVLSSASRIAVIGAGPSLTDDLPWLKENRDKLIVFAAHSAIRPLRAAGIEPDIQFCLDLDLDETTIAGHAFNTSIPLVADCRTNPTFLKRFEQVCLIAGKGVSYPVRFKTLLQRIMPTTGNLCVSLACFCQPAEIYLLGMDLGFKSKSLSHARGSLYDDREGAQEDVAGEVSLVVESNFPTSETVLTRPYFNEARIQIEDLLASEGKRCRVVNLSDGAKINGAFSASSDQLVLPEYDARDGDLKVIIESFGPSLAGREWDEFKMSGPEMVDFFRNEVLETLNDPGFSWPVFARRVDQVLTRVLAEAHQREPEDRRVQGYLDILKDILVAWYRFMCLSVNDEESQYLYDAGKTMLVEELNRMEWPQCEANDFHKH